MAWTSPRTWVAGEALTAALLNTHVRDNLKAIGDAWTSYTPDTEWTIGNGTLTAKYAEAGKLVFYSFKWVHGSTSTTGAGTFSLSLPVTPSAAYQYHPFGDCGVYDSSASGNSSRRFLTATWQTSSSRLIFINAYDGAPLTNATPFTIATGDVIAGQGFYEAA